jgi:putative addiction module component (TIGR02574 family)
MTPSIHELGIENLGMEERLALANELWESVAREMEAQPLTEAQRIELERRVAAADADPSEGTLWEDVLAEARARWRR